ncbi:CsgG/HfaB family protein [Spirochaetota bacterium]
MKKTFLVFILIFLCMPLFAGKMRIAIMDFRAKDISRSDAMKVSELIRNELINIGEFTVIERSQMREILKEQGFQKTGCTDVSCAVQVGKILSAKKILVGTVMRLGRKIIITGRIVDVEKGVAEFSEKGVARSKNNLDVAVENFSRKLSNTISGKRIAKRNDLYRTQPRARKEEPGSTSFHYSSFYLFNYNYVSPMNDFKDLTESGNGFSFIMSWDVLSRVNVGLGMGLYYFNNNAAEIDTIMMVPFYITLGYRLLFFDMFYIMPFIAGGGNYISILDDYDSTNSIDDGVKGEMHLGCRAGIFLGALFLDFSINYHLIPKFNERTQFITVNIGIGYGF